MLGDIWNDEEVLKMKTQNKTKEMACYFTILQIRI